MDEEPFNIVSFDPETESIAETGIFLERSDNFTFVKNWLKINDKIYFCGDEKFYSFDLRTKETTMETE